MEPDYTYAKSTAGLGQPGGPPMPELGRLKAAAERVGVAANRIDSFLTRFNGPMPESASATTNPGDNYRNDLESLFAQIERLESVSASLDRIG